MSQEIIQDVGRILLAGLIILTVLGVLRDAGLTGFSVASSEALFYTGPEKVFTKQGAFLTLDLDYYFSGGDIVYSVAPQEKIDAQLHNNILMITPAKDFSGEAEVTIHASNKEQIIRQKIIVNVEPVAPPKKCGCGG